MPVVTDYTALLEPDGGDFARWSELAPLGSAMVITYSFLENAELPPLSQVGYGATGTFSFTAAQRADVRLALQALADVSGIEVIEVEDGGMLDFHGITGSSVAGYAYYPAPWSQSGSTIAIDGDTGSDFSPGSSDFQVILHEIGHAVGLKHSHDGAITLAASVDDTDHTVMSYNWSWPPRADYAPLDVDALEFLYGADYDFAAAGIAYAWNEAAQRFTMTGGAGNDVLVAVTADSDLDGNDGHDGLYGQAGDDTLDGGAGNDTLSGSYGNNVLRGGAGNDLLISHYGDDTLDGGIGSDTADLSDAFWSWADLADTSRFTAIEHLVGGTMNNRFYGNSQGNMLDGGAGIDTLYGLDGDDTLIGGAAGDVIVGAGGRDAASYTTSAAGVVASLTAPSANTNDAAGDSYSGIEDLTGTGYGDRLSGDGTANKLIGGAGSDTLTGLVGNDTLAGGTGNDLLSGNRDDDRLLGGTGDDTLFGGAGADVLGGGAGRNTASYANAAKAVTASLANAAAGKGDAAGDSYYNIHDITGSDFADVLAGNAGNNRLFARDGDDRVFGWSGSDDLDGGDGGDTLDGGAGGDVLTGGQGADLLTGGSGGDYFDFNQAGESPAGGFDTISDFSSADGDRIALATIDANALAGGNQAFSFIGAAAFSGSAGELRFATAGGNGYVSGDVDGDAVLDFQILLTGITAMTAGDFVL